MLLDYTLSLLLSLVIVRKCSNNLRSHLFLAVTSLIMSGLSAKIYFVKIFLLFFDLFINRTFYGTNTFARIFW